MKTTKTDWRSCLGTQALNDLMMISLQSEDISQFNPIPPFNLWRSQRSVSGQKGVRRPTYVRSHKHANNEDSDSDFGEDGELNRCNSDNDTGDEY